MIDSVAVVRIESVISASQIRERVARLAAQLYRDYADTPLSVLVIAQGGCRFADDLLAELGRRGLRPERQEVRARRSVGTELGPLEIEHFEPEAFEGRDVLVVDDVADEGETLRAVYELLALGEPRSVRSAVLVDKGARRRQEPPLDYVGFAVGGGWLVGYGMDLDGEYRELDWIGRLVDDRF